MPQASGSIVRALPLRTRRLRPLAFMALAAPLALGACVAEKNGMKSAALVRKSPAAASAGGPDAYGYVPARLAALDDGFRVALPSAKPDIDKLKAAAPAAVPSAAISVNAKLAAAKPAQPVDELAALKADVDERRASLVVMASGKGDRVAPASEAPQPMAAAAPAPGAPKAEATKGTSVRDLVDPRVAVPAAISAVANSADAVKVAAVDTTAKAIDTTAKAFDAVQNRIGDTFKGTDTITGSAAIDEMIEESANENNIPSELAYAVVRVESHYNPTAIGGGAYGLSQIKPATARGLGFDGPAQGLFDPRTNLRYGMKYLAGAWEKSGHDICGTAMRYKGGHRTTVMTRAAAVYCSNVKRHIAAIERRRAPANRETLFAAAQRSRQIMIAGRSLDVQTKNRMTTASSAGDKAVSAKAAPAAAPEAVVAFAAASDAGRAVTASGVPATAGAAVNVANAGGIKSGRVRVYADGEAMEAASTIASNGRFGYAD